MTIETNNYTVIKANDGYFLANRDMSIYGYEIVLGKYDSPENYTEYPVSEWPSIPEPIEQQEPDDNQNPETQIPDRLSLAKAAKLRDIDAYDNSANVNGFRYNGNMMWLDRDTRASLRNTIESSILLNRDELDIWFGDIYITLSINVAKLMLATLEVYATDCYNITALHKAQVKALNSVAEVEAFDVTTGYPQMPEFSNE